MNINNKYWNDMVDRAEQNILLFLVEKFTTHCCVRDKTVEFLKNFNYEIQ